MLNRDKVAKNSGSKVEHDDMSACSSLELLISGQAVTVRRHVNARQFTNARAKLRLCLNV